MKLKKIEIYGFKSFAQKTEIVFSGGMTGIVGPNGSGKSNISDAVRWVLGEQSAKTLRGGSMQDVIFNGTQKRKPLGYCEVSLCFDNEDRTLPIDYAEVMVTRRVYRSGEGEYFLNRSSCRLKEIVDLFRDTGIGREGYSVIGQGRIDEILSKKGEDRRAVFEEAAGIAKYRTRKEEADRKLERTTENMIRVKDLLQELEDRLGPLEKQAETARAWLEKSETLKQAELNLFLYRSDRMKERTDAINIEMNGLHEAMEREESEIAQKTAERDECRREAEELSRRVNEAHAGQLEGLDALHRAQEAVTEQENLAANRQAEQQRLKDEEQASAAEEERLHAALERGREEIEKCARSRETAEEQLNAAKEAEAAAKSVEQEKERALEYHQSYVMESMDRLSGVMNRETRMKTEQAGLRKRIEEAENALSDMAEEKSELENKLKNSEDKLQEETESRRRLSDEWKKTSAELESADEKAFDKREAFERQSTETEKAESRRKILAEMSETMEGYHNAVRAVIREAKNRNVSGVHGVLAQLLSVPKHLETAMDMTLGASQQDIVTSDEETAKRMIEYLRENRFGRATFMPVASVKSRGLDECERGALKMQGCLGVASELVKYDQTYKGIVENLLGRTVVADSLEHGIEIMRAYRYSFRLVTLNGDVMHPGGSMTGGYTGASTANLFSRVRELNELTETLKTARNELEKLQNEMSACENERLRLKNVLSDTLSKLHEQEIAVTRETGTRDSIRNMLEAHTQRISAADTEVKLLKAELEESERQLALFSTDANREQNDRLEMERKTEVLKGELAVARDETAKAAEKAVQAALVVNDLRHTAEELMHEKERLTREADELIKARRQREKTASELALREHGDSERLNELNAVLEKCRAEHGKREEEVKALEELRSAGQEKLTGLMEAVEKLHAALNMDGERVHKLEVGMTRTEGDLKALQERIWNTYELTYAGAEPYRQTEGFRPSEAEKTVSVLTAEIREMGPVNTNAAQEYAELKARYDENTVQYEDLEKAERDLRDLIRGLLRSMRETFTEQFALMQTNFQETFSRLFGGGSAELVLSDPEDPLNCGIEVNVRIPGKKQQLLSLLSGGERALTAIAILFAMLKLKPTPFCILDEIEAALDDANIGYFADYLAEYSKNTQFIVITHRKGTMERTDGLYGVSMEEQGVSKLASVSLKDYKD